ncbi:cytosine permease [Mycobacterium sp. 21AC1]|uniref:cytosine permease n=1 Tax=[Mycobacterium] appelbergii TaxID=2939269 RepID=UPI002938D2CC|nr:cytosine permease [Mycobacterium sp. 21AC1]MDV3125832.1 cytosine permease [Mycobacterium sp. 21AC1]
MADTGQLGSPTQAPHGRFDPTITDLPLLRGERIWNFWQHSAVNAGLAVATWAFLQGAAVAYYVGVKQAIAAMIIGYGISVLLVALAPCLPSVKYGIEQFVGIRSTFGERGARIVMVAVSTLLAAAWSAVLAIMFGHGLVTVVNNVFGIALPETGVAASIMALIAIVVSWLILSRGPVSVEAFCRAIAPVLILIVVGVIVIVFSRYSWSELTALAPLGGISDDPHLSFMLAIELNLAGGFAWWPNLGNLARLTKTSRAAFWPNWIGVFAASAVAAAVGVLAALSLQVEDPTQWFIPLAGVVLGIIALIVVCLANVTAILSQGYASMVALKGGGGALLRKTAWPLLGVVILGPAAVLVFFPAAVYENYGRFVSWGAILLAPMCAVQIVDFFILRRRQISVRALYQPVGESPYSYWKGVNVAAFVAIGAGALAYALLLNPVDYEPAAVFRYTTASLPAFGVAAIVHYLLTRLIVMPQGLGGYPRPSSNGALDLKST